MPSLRNLEVGASIGIARTTRWYDGGTEAGTVASGTAVSADVTYWPVPVAGLRLHAGTFGSRIRTQREAQGLRGVLFDVSAVVRPLALVPDVPAPLRTVYAFAGGGGLSTSTSGRGDSILVCGPDACSEVDSLRVRGSATVGQLTAGAGGALRLGGGWSVYAEAALHVYHPEFTRTGAGAGFHVGPRAGVAPGPPPAGYLGGGSQPVSMGRVTTSRITAGARRTFGTGTRPSFPPPPPLPPPPPAAEPTARPSPTRGGWVEVRTATPGAEVYLVPRTVLEDDPAIACRMRPVMGSEPYFKGRTTSTAAVRAYAAPSAWVLIVRQHGREHHERVQLAGGRTRQVTLNMRVDGTPTRCRR